VERVDRNESTGRDTVYMATLNKASAAQINQHTAVSEMQKTNPALFEISNGRVTPSRQNNRSEMVQNDNIVVTRIENAVTVKNKEESRPLHSQPHMATQQFTTKLNTSEIE